MDKELVSLDEYNKAKLLESYREVFNGIKCPICKHELVDVKDAPIFLTSPPQQKIKCIRVGCDFVGRRFC